VRYPLLLLAPNAAKAKFVDQKNPRSSNIIIGRR